MSTEQRPPRPASLTDVLRALRATTREDAARPAGVARLRYRFPRRWVLSMGRDLALGRRRSFRADCELAVRCLPIPPVVEGLEHVPASGSFVLLANHYQRRDLWIGWPGALLCAAMWRVRPDLRCHWIVEDRAVIGRSSVLWTKPLFARVASVWDFVLVTPWEARDADALASRRIALRSSMRLLHPSAGQSTCLCLLPEGVRGSSAGLVTPAPGVGRSLRALAGRDIPLLPAALWEEPSGALHARFGKPWRPEPRTTMGRDSEDALIAETAMRQIAALLPPPFRGAYA